MQKRNYVPIDKWIFLRSNEKSLANYRSCSVIQTKPLKAIQQVIIDKSTNPVMVLISNMEDTEYKLQKYSTMTIISILLSVPMLGDESFFYVVKGK